MNFQERQTIYKYSQYTNIYAAPRELMAFVHGWFPVIGQPCAVVLYNVGK